MARDPEDFSAIYAVVGFADLTEQTILLVRKLAADGRPAQAQEIRKIYGLFREEMYAIATKIALRAEEKIKQSERASRVRPDSTDTVKLETHLGNSEAIAEIPGSVAVNFEPDLPSWWWTNEEGYSGHIGRSIFGVFTPSNTAPSASQFRTDSGFTPTRSGSRGIIRNPIPERRFVKKGSDIAEAAWHVEVRAAKRRFLERATRAVASIKPKATP